jgi:hypothetical protein
MRIWFVPLLAAAAACGSPPRLGTAPDPAQVGPATPPENVTEVEIESFVGVAKCRRYVATGTRIAGERCESDGDDTTAEAAEYELMRRDVEAMRSQQVYRDQARQAAEAAMRRGAR